MNGDDAAKAQARYAPDPAPHMPPDVPVARTHEELRENLARLHSVGSCAEAQTSANPKDVAARDRCPLHLIPPIAETEIAWVLGDGASKYGRYNWRAEKISLLTYLGAMRRHINRILDGEDVDGDSGLLHLAHVAATACIVMDALDHDCVIDDRPNGDK